MNNPIDRYTDRWLLPDGVNELLPEDAWRVESLRRMIMDNAYRWGYELVMPPLIEYLDSLLTGTGETLDVQTFKFIDQHNGRTLGVRADMTPQVARIDAHAMRSDLPNRLFYTGSVLRARTNGAGSSRTPLQFGAELFGHAGAGSDVEVIQLMLENVMMAGLTEDELLLDVGHVGVFRALISNAGLTSGVRESLFQALLRGSRPEIDDLLDEAATGQSLRKQFQALTGLNGDAKSVISRAREALKDSGPAVLEALDYLQAVIDALGLTFPTLKMHIDLAELRGYRYHTGMLFALYDESGSELARGGRYDAIGESFGRARPATGFSGDLVNLASAQRSIESHIAPASTGIWVDAELTAALWREVRQLRASGRRVVVALAGSDMSPASCQCDSRLIEQSGKWVESAL